MYLSQIFNSKAKTEVIRTLYYAADKVPLREISYRSNLNIRSVQLAVKKLVDMGLIKKIKQGNKVFFTLNKKNNFFCILDELFDATSSIIIRETEWVGLKQRTKNAVEDIDTLRAMIIHAKRFQIKNTS